MIVFEEKALNRHVGSLIQQYRKGGELAMTQAELASKSSLSRASISSIENGSQQVSLISLYRLANALEVDISDLLPSINTMNELSIKKPHISIAGERAENGTKALQDILARHRPK